MNYTLVHIYITLKCDLTKIKLKKKQKCLSLYALVHVAYRTILEKYHIHLHKDVQRLLLEFSNSRRLEADFCNIVLYIT